ncbi:branched-chain amino acid ABC transporter permease [Ochrobactrum soli]|uniref:Branched-chain amino acid ABC transporter permease n=1 Tax=Ochrobactrum soli TaxID=2448455 RepID=A0A849KWU0_9HYPH|nr:branched-chain amino acid ABC transporter permease [[Ochrobactrum] soli]NNU62928.1 branched-chain amino acid ABC transporter permease [[Ochrobactrum] soli]
MQITLNILSLTSFYVCFSIGLALVFGVMRVVNFAHGDFYMVGAYTAWAVLSVISPVTGNLVGYAISAGVAALVLAAMGLLANAAIIRPLADRPLGIYVATLSLSYILQVCVVQAFGAVGQVIKPSVPGVLFLGGAIMPFQRVLVMVVAAIMIVALWLFMEHSRLGRAMRAVAQNKRGALLQGVNIKLVGSLAVVIGAIMAGTAGVVMAPVAGVNPFMGVDALWKAFIIIIVGGIGSIWGAVAAALMFGIFDTLVSVAGFGRFLAMFSALIMLIVLSVRPQGLFGEKD